MKRVNFLIIGLFFLNIFYLSHTQVESLHEMVKTPIKNSGNEIIRDLGDIVYETSGSTSDLGPYDSNILAEDITLSESGETEIGGVELVLNIDGEQSVKLWFFDQLNSPAIHVEDLGSLNTYGQDLTFQFELNEPLLVPQNFYFGVSIQGNGNTDWIDCHQSVITGSGTPFTYFYGSIAGGILDNNWTSSNGQHFNLKIYTAADGYATPTDVTISVDNNETSLAWEDLTNAEMYYIYRSANPDYGFVKIDSTTNTYYIDVEGGSGFKYFYNVTSKITVTNDFEWCNVPAGDYSWGQHDAPQFMPYDYQIMKYEVTNFEYLTYLEEAYLSGDIWIEGENVVGYYEGDENWIAGNYNFYSLGIPSADNYARISWNGSTFDINVPAGYNIGDYDNHPVVRITWFGCWAFADHYNLSLPTEREWEKAARDNTGNDYPWGDNIDGSRANYHTSGDQFDNGTTPVGYYNGDSHNGFQTTDSPSTYGAYDMSGNVWEWTNNWFHSVSVDRAYRGGSWSNISLNPVWFRNPLNPNFTDSNLGFRCVSR